MTLTGPGEVECRLSYATDARASTFLVEIGCRQLPERTAVISTAVPAVMPESPEAFRTHSYQCACCCFSLGSIGPDRTHLYRICSVQSHLTKTSAGRLSHDVLRCAALHSICIKADQRGQQRCLARGYR